VTSGGSMVSLYRGDSIQGLYDNQHHSVWMNQVFLWLHSLCPSGGHFSVSISLPLCWKWQVWLTQTN